MKVTDEIASVQHDIWSHWMRYLFEVSFENQDGSVTISPEKVARWRKQMYQGYNELSDKERESDMEQAVKVIDALKKLNVPLDT